MSVYKRGKVFVMDFVVNGQRVFKSTGKSTKKEAKLIEVAEKRVISNKATVGIYYWSKGSDYVRYAEQMISKNIRVNNEFYVCPVFNEAIQDNKKIKTFDIDRMWGIGTPNDLNYFLENYDGDITSR